MRACVSYLRRLVVAQQEEPQRRVVQRVAPEVPEADAKVAHAVPREEADLGWKDDELMRGERPCASQSERVRVFACVSTCARKFVTL